MLLDKKQLKQLRGMSHELKPVVTIGNKGLSEQVITEIDNALGIHELIKVKLPAGPRDFRQSLVDQFCPQVNAQQAGLTGRIALLFRKNPEKKNSIKLV